MTYLKSNQDSDCCGCTACEQICPRSCIRMSENSEGFLYPVVDSRRCIQCGLCEKVCPIENYQRVSQNDVCYYGWHRESKIREMSTSGGAFAAIAQALKKKGFIHFYGAVYDDDFSVHHVDILNFKRLDLICGSKYTQSRMDNVYSDVKRNLYKGEKVAFCGTPCQVDGLKKYIKNEDDNLFLIALVCHGVSSPKAYSKYLSELERTRGTKIKSVKFRDKRRSNALASATTIEFENQTVISTTDNEYTTAFRIGVMDRESCYHCPYSSPAGAGDITIGDFWGIEKEKPELNSEIPNGISLMIPHTIKAEELIKMLKEIMIIEKVPLTYAMNEKQPQLTKPLNRPWRRNFFLKRVLLHDCSFHREAQKAIFEWKIRERVKRCFRRIALNWIR